MIYFKSLQTNEIIEFSNIQEIGAIFYDTTLYATPTQSEIDTHLFNKKKEELIKYAEEQKDLKKVNYIVKQGANDILMQYSIDAIINILNQMKDENIYPTFIYYDKQFVNKVDFNNQNELLFILNKFITARRNNYHNNIPVNMQLINTCTTLEELENLQLIFVDLVINL